MSKHTTSVIDTVVVMCAAAQRPPLPPLPPLREGGREGRLAAQPRPDSPSHFRAQDRRRAGPGAHGHFRDIAIILAGNLYSQFGVLSLSLVNLSRTNLFNKLLLGLTNILVINRPALA